MSAMVEQGQETVYAVLIRVTAGRFAPPVWRGALRTKSHAETVLNPGKNDVKVVVGDLGR